MAIQSVIGPVEPAELGFTLPHEHLLSNLTKEYRGDGLLNDVDLMVAELAEYREAGGGSLVDCTTIGLGRDPVRIKEIASRSGVNVIMGTGFYREPYLEPDWIDRRDVASIAGQLVEEIETGVADTGIRAGLIGEVGADKWYISAVEERSLRAAARAQRSTGVAITTHAARWPVGLAQLDIFAEEGVDPRKVIIGHCDTVPDPGYHLALAKRGCYVQFDTIGLHRSEYDLRRRVEWVRNLIDHGFGAQILISHDICLRTALRATGGAGFAFITNTFLPLLGESGLAKEQLDGITVRNVATALDPA
ncbi:phosphotriesterase-related protein [Tamaricihabitans halophyticus]|uniref:Phosphotriesterase-related protein n=1 Tax=Tamaricihabitans halophyticus TaxID=1262583 RepID=A0A4R2QFQ0_9PSEU|nr:phosphotriesterase-related protein [Tamaricihabitans halophyticus]TCP47344.1 phosphotriesterase-related protein [Tamaricihabitans halophyticus]